jgi:hypothetical protein
MRWGSKALTFFSHGAPPGWGRRQHRAPREPADLRRAETKVSAGASGLSIRYRTYHVNQAILIPRAYVRIITDREPKASVAERHDRAPASRLEKRAPRWLKISLLTTAAVQQPFHRLPPCASVRGAKEEGETA